MVVNLMTETMLTFSTAVCLPKVIVLLVMCNLRIVKMVALQSY